MGDASGAGAQGQPADTPSLRASTRNVARINYAELNNSGVDESNASRGEDATFRTPSSTTRGRKRRPLDDLASGMSGVTLSTGQQSKRGRPRGSTSGPGRGRGRGRVQAAVGGDKVGPDATAYEGTLFGAVKSNKNIDDMLDEWIEEYATNYSTALAKLLQFFFSICGCKGKVPTHFMSNVDYPTLIKQMTENFGEESNEYPLLQGGSYRKFRANLHIFLNHLILKCKSSVIFDNRMMDMIVQLLTQMADSAVRAFRHTATFCAMKICSALVDVALELAKNAETNMRQMEAEKAKVKQTGTTTSDKMDFLMQQKDEMETHMDEVRQMLTYLFKSVFVHRYRDILADTRSICITELGNWIMVYPEHFLEDSYLKYIGWTLYDKQPEVRLRCLNALYPLYDKSDNLPKLELFTNKFKDRLVSMVLDVDMETAVRACQLMSSIYRVFPTILASKDCIPIYELVYSNHRGLAVAAGEFLNTKVFQQTRTPRAGGRGLDGLSKNAPLLKDLIRFFIEGECHDHTTYLVDALIDTNEMMKDWKTMTDLLMAKDELDPGMEGTLIDILCCSVKQASTGELPPGRSIVKRGAPLQRESKSVQDDRERLTSILIPTLPKLLEKFIGDREKISHLATLPTYFVLDMYMAGRMENYLLELWQILEEVINKHIDDDSLGAVAETIAYLMTNASVATYSERFRTTMIDSICAQTRHCIQKYPQEGTDMDDAMVEEIRAETEAAFRKMAAFSCVLDLRRVDIAEQAAAFLQANSNTLSDAVIEKCILIMFTQMIFDLNRIIRDQESNRAEAIRKLKKKRDSFVQVAGRIIKYGSNGVTMSFVTMCDTMILFNQSLVTDDSEKSKQLQPLVCKLGDTVRRSMMDFVERCVFKRTLPDSSEPYQQVEFNHKKRNILANFAKLAIHDCIEPEEVAFIIKYYQEFHTDFGDILKIVLCKLRDIEGDRMMTASRVVAKTIISAYEELIENLDAGQKVEPGMESFVKIRDLAKRLASIFGTNFELNRFAIVQIHKAGIDFVFKEGAGENPNDTLVSNTSTTRHSDAQKGPPPNLLFIEILIEFSHKLTNQDKKEVLKYLEGKSSSTSASSHEAYHMYKHSLTKLLPGAPQSDQPDDVSVRSASVMRAVSVASMDSPMKGGTPTSTPKGTPSHRGRPRVSRMMEED